MALMYIPRQTNPWTQMLPQFLQQVAMQKMSQKYQTERAETQRGYQEEDTLRELQLAGYRESKAHKPEIEVGGKGLIGPKTDFEIKMMGGKPFLVKSVKKYGEETGTPLEMKPLTGEAGKYKVGELKDFKIGDKFVTGEYTGDPKDSVFGISGWKDTGARAPRYKPTTNVNVNMKEKQNPIEVEAGKKYGTLLGEQVGKRSTQAFEANNQNKQLDTVKLALAQGARTGFGEETILGLRSLAETLGIDSGDLSGQELIRKTSNEMALRLRNPESGLGLTGNTSNKDLDFLKASVIGLSRTERGNVKIIDSMQKFNDLKIAVANEQDRIIKENGGSIPYDIDSRLMKFVDNHKFFTQKEMVEIKRLSQPIINTGKIFDKSQNRWRKVVQFQDGSKEYAD